MAVNPRRGKPQGSNLVGAFCSFVQRLGSAVRAKAQKSRFTPPYGSLIHIKRERNGKWASQGGNTYDALLVGEGFEGKKPKSAVSVKQNSLGFRGLKSPRG